MEEESSIIDSLDVAMAVKASGGKVIVQVKNVSFFPVYEQAGCGYTGCSL